MKKFIRVRMHQKYDFSDRGGMLCPYGPKSSNSRAAWALARDANYTDKKFQQFFIILINFIFFLRKKKSVFVSKHRNHGTIVCDHATRDTQAKVK